MVVSSASASGFGVSLAATLACIAWLLWALVPDNILAQMHITYYPAKYWAGVLPVFVLGLIPFTLAVFAAINLRNTAPFHAKRSLTDQHAHVAAPGLDIVSSCSDIPICKVNKAMFYNKPHRSFRSAKSSISSSML